MRELLLGCGYSRVKLMAPPGEPLAFANVCTVDKNLDCEPDVFCDLDTVSWSCTAITPRGAECVCSGITASKQKTALFRSEFFYEIHAYEVLHQLGAQGDAASFFNTFAQCHRLLRPGGFLFATVPSRYSARLWGDPANRRVIYPESLYFLEQQTTRRYRENGTPMSDHSKLWPYNFKIIAASDNHERFAFALQKCQG